jgi:undecaprenyl diphosphate synthase
LIKNDIRLSAVGRRDRLPVRALELLRETEEVTRPCKRLHLRLALDYGSRFEIVQAARSLARSAAAGELRPEDINESCFASSLCDERVPDPDLIIRTAGERRLSNFLLWQAAYAELYFCPKLWPEFGESDLQEAIADYHTRTRRFGAVVPAEATGTEGISG